MLSKLRYFSDTQVKEPPEFFADENLAALLKRLGAKSLNVRRVDSGTLGVGFIAYINGRHRFLKTHATSEGRETLTKEAAILSRLYGTLIHVECIEINDVGCPRLWLTMDELTYPQNDLTIKQALCIISGYSEQLELCVDTLPIPANDNFRHLLTEGSRALQSLQDNGLLSDAVQRRARSCLSMLDRKINHFPLYPCHGDFGPKNLMSDGTNPVVIDWEDAFWGIEGYDYLFWLTFFDNRKFFSQKVLGNTPWGKEIEIAILVLIVVLKSALSFRSGTYKKNTITFNERVLEVLGLE